MSYLICSIDVMFLAKIDSPPNQFPWDAHNTTEVGTKHTVSIDGHLLQNSKRLILWYI